MYRTILKRSIKSTCSSTFYSWFLFDIISRK
nr:MAG TPA: hypothetical protein [Caudoviricetes sp.]